MIGNQLHQFAHDECMVAQLCEDSQMFVGRAGVEPLSVVGTDRLFVLPRLILEFPSLPPYLDITLFLFSSLFPKDAPSPLSPAAIE